MPLADGLPAEMKAYMLHDWEAGRRLELQWLSGAVVRMAAEHVQEVSVTRAIWETLEFHAEARRRAGPSAGSASWSASASDAKPFATRTPFIRETMRTAQSCALFHAYRLSASE